MKHWRCHECGDISINRFTHVNLKHKDWGFKITKIEWDRLNFKFEQVENILGSWTIVHPINRIGKTASK